MERALIILKPDAVQRGLIGPILSRLEQRGLRFQGLKLIQMTKDMAYQHYAEHEGKSFFSGLISYITSAPVLVLVVTGKAGTVELVRAMVGATNPAKAAPGTIRGDFGLEIGRNLIHASDSPENGERETEIFFKSEELIGQWERAIHIWIHE
ncbi:nucleoside-diphosphate kinase [Candidatus Chloroploca sp. M-50]|uniref:Nucleoside diphosphate kinase n=1 Tax=Candidatus Chloroploca mongolica TaxID=2528176 RepID=A0ABS4DAS9_9CHLR|nr:nucleoside-diphosphate kinase [Candidatus Chloroploca mongolica]MBP1466541.1 nucleoside-diphosphate kinase [Candidatus Chloroploca mongolica]